MQLLHLICLVFVAREGSCFFGVLGHSPLDQGYIFNPDYERFSERPTFPPFPYYPSQQFQTVLPQEYEEPAPRYPGWYRPDTQDVPVVIKLPNSETVVVPFKAVYMFPSIIERLVQRIQTYYSVYNPPEHLTVDRPWSGSSTTEEPSTTSSTTTEEPEDLDHRFGTDETSTDTPETTTLPPKVSTLSVYEVTPSSEEPSSSTGTETTTDSPEASKVSTLAVYEVSPSSEEPSTTLDSTTPESTTDSDSYVTPESTVPEGFDYNIPMGRLLFDAERVKKSSNSK